MNERSIETDHGRMRNPTTVLLLSGTMNQVRQPGSSLRVIVQRRPQPPTSSKVFGMRKVEDALVELGGAKAAQNIQ